MRPKDLKTKIFLDGGDPQKTRDTIKLLGFLDGQTTNPTLISRNPDVQARLERGEKFSEDEIYDFYKNVVKEISTLIPDGSVSVEVYADVRTRADAMGKQAKEMFAWIANAHIKYPITSAGLTAANQSIKEGLRVNMTLCFTQAQAAAVYGATSGAKRGDVFVSPFIGRLDDKGENGMDLIANTIKMYQPGDGHSQVLTASVRNMNHFMEALRLGSDIITAPYDVLKIWGEQNMPLPDENFKYEAGGLKPIPYQELDINQDWRSFHIKNELTDKGIERFSNDWNALVK